MNTDACVVLTSIAIVSSGDVLMTSIPLRTWVRLLVITRQAEHVNGFETLETKYLKDRG
jgi:hypothetical protein